LKILKCKVCRGEVDIIADEYSINKKIKCQDCGFTGEKLSKNNVSKTEVIVSLRGKVLQEEKETISDAKTNLRENRKS